MSSLFDVLDDYGLGYNEQARKLVETLLENLSELAGSEEPQEPPIPPKPKEACVGTYVMENGNNAVLAYDTRWLGVNSKYPFMGYLIPSLPGSSNVPMSGTWIGTGAYDSVGEYPQDLVVPEGLVHVHYACVHSDEAPQAPRHPLYPARLYSYDNLDGARRNNPENLPILRITYRDDQIISAQLVNDWEVA